MSSLAATPVIVGVIFFAIGLRAGAPAFPRAGRQKLLDSAPRPAYFREPFAGRVDLNRLASADFRFSATRGAYESRGLAKRIVDVAAATALLLITSPLVALAAIAIRIDSPGPVLYRQRRIGRGGEPFDIFKFRSMIADAEPDGARWAGENDARVTRVGHLMREMHIDEIPQALNVLRGEMSFVGPRPERPEFVEILETEIPNYHLRHMVKPGITGWAQINYVYGSSVEDARIKLQYDLHYIKKFSLYRDFIIMLKTVRVALFGLDGR